MSPLLEENFNESSFFITLPLKRYRLRTGGGSLPLKQSVTFQFRNFLVSRLLPILGGFRSENLVKKIQKIWSGIKSPNFRFGKFDLCKTRLWFGKFGLRKTGFVSISENLVSEKSLGFGSVQNFGLVIQCSQVMMSLMNSPLIWEPFDGKRGICHKGQVCNIF